MTKFIEKFGWFRFCYHSDVAELLSITNQLTGQSLTVQSVVGSSPLDDDKQYTAVYRDEDIAQTVTFSVCRNAPYAGQLSDYFSISLDYENVYRDIPLYGHWRRLDDFITDALLCWRPQRIGSVTITGGWVGGQWCNKIQRQYNVINGLSWEESNNIAEPYLYPLDGTDSQSWQLYDTDNKPESEYNLSYQFYPNTQMPYIPIDKTPQDFEGRVPYLQSKNKKRFFIFTGANFDIHPYSDSPFVTSNYTYLDEEVFFDLRQYMSYCVELDGTVSNYGFRHYPPKRDFWAMKYQKGYAIADPHKHSEYGDYQGYLYPSLSYAVWLRVKHAFCDAWQAWKSCRYRLFDESTFKYRGQTSTFTWDEPYGGKAAIRGGFVAGIFVPQLSVSIKYA